MSAGRKYRKHNKSPPHYVWYYRERQKVRNIVGPRVPLRDCRTSGNLYRLPPPPLLVGIARGDELETDNTVSRNWHTPVKMAAVCTNEITLDTVVQFKIRICASWWRKWDPRGPRNAGRPWNVGGGGTNLQNTYYTLLQFLSRLVLLLQGSILEPCYEIRE
jgi:hypothetical protein